MKRIEKLLNEYEEYEAEQLSAFGPVRTIKWKYNEDEDEFIDRYNNNRLDTDSLYFIKKFVSFLVDNNKIDFNKVNKVYYEEARCEYDGRYVSYKEFSDEEILLMRLVLQEIPLEYLLNYIREDE